MYISQLGLCQPVPDSRRPLIPSCHPIRPMFSLQHPALPSLHHSCIRFHILKSIRSFTNYTLPGSRSIKCPTPSMCTICTTIIFLSSSHHPNCIIPCFAHGFLNQHATRTVTIPTSCPVSTCSRTLKSASSLLTILRSSTQLGT